jgi:ligand-binding SRPBCC domain-containing protein
MGGSILRDEIEYELRGGVLGRWLFSGFLAGELRRAFEFRHEVTRRWVEGQSGAKLD